MSGYGHFAQFNQKSYYRNRLKGLLSLLCSYWLVVILFTGVSYLSGHGAFMPGNAGRFVRNLLLLEHSFNGAWWYMFTYAVLVIFSPLLLQFIKSNNVFIVIIPAFGIYCVGFYTRYYVASASWLLLKVGPLAMTLFEYILGAVALKYKVFSRICDKMTLPNRTIRCVFAAGIIIALGYVRTTVIGSLFVAPVSGFAVMTIFHFWRKPNFVQKVFSYIGYHSTNIWLTHMFFVQSLFKNFVYVAKYPLLIFALMLIITLIISNILKIIEVPIQKEIAKL